MKKGHVIVIEGLDGSGKETQSKKLYEKLLETNIPVMRLSYPRYEKESSALVRMYLRGDFGEDPQQISPYISSTFFAADRYASYKTEVEDFYREGGIVIADRYTTSNMLHQAGKMKDDQEVEKFLDWLWHYEFELYQIPKPDLVLYLDIPLEETIKRIENRDREQKITEKKDIHEGSRDHLLQAAKRAGQLVEKYGWTKVSCAKDGQWRSIDEISDEVFAKVLKVFESQKEEEGNKK